MTVASCPLGERLLRRVDNAGTRSLENRVRWPGRHALGVSWVGGSSSKRPRLSPTLLNARPPWRVRSQRGCLEWDLHPWGPSRFEAAHLLGGGTRIRASPDPSTSTLTTTSPGLVPCRMNANPPRGWIKEFGGLGRGERSSRRVTPAAPNPWAPQEPPPRLLRWVTAPRTIVRAVAEVLVSVAHPVAAGKAQANVRRNRRGATSVG